MRNFVLGFCVAFSSRPGSTTVASTARAASGAVPFADAAPAASDSTRTPTSVMTLPRPPLPQRALERNSPPRLPEPQRALWRTSPRLPPVFLAIFLLVRNPEGRVPHNLNGRAGVRRKCRPDWWNCVKRMRRNGDVPPPLGSRPLQVHSIEGGRRGPPTVLGSADVSARLAVESFAARAAARLSRVAGAGGGTTLPGKLLWKLDPGAIDALAARLPQGAAVVSATNGKTTTTAMVAEILGSRTRLAWNSSGANLVSGVASTLLAQRDAELGLLEVDEGALSEVVAPGPAARNPPREPLPRPARPLRRARAHRRALARGNRRASARRRARRQRGRPAGGRSRARTAQVRSRSGSTTRATPGLRSSTRPTRVTACAVAGRTTSRRPTSGTSATTAVPTAATRDPRCRCGRRRSSWTGSQRRPSRSRRLRGASACVFPSLVSTTSTTRSARPLWRRRSGRRWRRSAPAWSGSAPRSAASSGSRSVTSGS